MSNGAAGHGAFITRKKTSPAGESNPRNAPLPSLYRNSGDFYGFHWKAREPYVSFVCITIFLRRRRRARHSEMGVIRKNSMGNRSYAGIYPRDGSILIMQVPPRYTVISIEWQYFVDGLLMGKIRSGDSGRVMKLKTVWNIFFRGSERKFRGRFLWGLWGLKKRLGVVCVLCHPVAVLLKIVENMQDKCSSVVRLQP